MRSETARRRRVSGTAAILAFLAGCVAAGERTPDGYAAWRKGMRSKVPHREAAVVAADHKLFVFGGFYTPDVKTTAAIEVYDPAADRWSRLKPMPSPPVTHLTAARDGDTLWFAGGFLGDHPGPATDQVWQYRLSIDSWEPGPPLPGLRGSGFLERVGRRLHFVGGYVADRITGSASHWTLNLDGDTVWREAAPLPNPRGHIAGVELRGQLYVIGGAFHHDPIPDDVRLVQRYDPTTNIWTELASLPRPLSHAEPSTFVLDENIVVVGGRDFENAERRPTEAVTAILVYDPAVNTWTEIDDLPVPLHGAEARLIGDHLVVHGGSPAWDNPRRETWRLRFRDVWRPRPSLPVALGEVAAGIVGRSLLVVGEGSPATLRFALDSGHWADPKAVAQRPFPGHHHAAEVWGGRLYLFGGFGAEGKTQIYEPGSNTWRLGAPLPFATASASSAVLGDRICVAGGIVDSRTTNQTACYDPSADSWTPAAPMPHGRNHAASGTDGMRLFVFGGRGPGSGDANVVANGFADVQVYDPAADRWRSSLDPGTELTPLPQARGGTGKAVYLNGEFYVFGGETEDAPGATPEGVYARVDIYDPRTNSWRSGAPLPVPRHGIFPVAVADRVLLAGGGARSGWSQSQVFDIYTPPASGRREPEFVSTDAGRTPPASRGAPRRSR
jgi:N-acetylneuraminic acid mutarotase